MVGALHTSLDVHSPVKTGGQSPFEKENNRKNQSDHGIHSHSFLKARQLVEEKKLHQRVLFDTASWFDGAFGADSGRSGFLKKRSPVPVVQALTVLLLMSILTQALFALVRGDFVTFAFSSARHTLLEL